MNARTPLYLRVRNSSRTVNEESERDSILNTILFGPSHHIDEFFDGFMHLRGGSFDYYDEVDDFEDVD